MTKLKALLGVFYAIISSATFGLIPLFSIPLLSADIGSPTILLYRMGLAMAMTGLIGVVLRKNFRISSDDLLVLFLLSIAYAATSLGLLFSYSYIPSGVATTINFLYPLVVAIIMMLFFGEKASIWMILAIIISLIGVTLLSWGDLGDHSPATGVMYAGATVFSYAIYIVGVMKSRVSRIDSLVVAFYVLLFASIMFLVYALFTTGVTIPARSDVWINFLLLAALPTVLSNLTLVMAIKNIGSTMTSILGSMEPLTAVVIGVLHFREKFSADSAAGVIMVIAAVIIVIMQSREKTESTTEE